jgi:DNA mismatch endonuclease (patch repair protein)
MRNTPRRDNGLELSIRRLVFAAGLRYRVDFRPLANLRRRGDLVFAGAKVVVFLDGCFWHCCPRHATWPKANRAWWRRKLLGNVARDRDTDRRLREAGWLVLRFWEHCRPEAAAKRIVAVVVRRTASPLSRPRRVARRGARATGRGSRRGT